MRSLRIGLFVETFPVVSETFIFEKVLELLTLGHDIQIFILKQSSDWQKYQNKVINITDLKKRVHCANINYSRTEKLIKLFKLVFTQPLSMIYWIVFNIWISKNSLVSKADKILNRLNFFNVKLDLLMVEFDTFGYKVVDLNKYLGCKVLINIRGIAQSTGTYRSNPTILSFLNEYADYYCFASHFLKLNSYKYGMDQNIPSRVVYGGVSEVFHDIEYKKRLFNNPVCLLSVGRLAWSKGYEFVIDAVAKLRLAGFDVRYKIVGEGPHKDAILKCANYYGFLNNNIVTLAGAKDQRHIINFLQDSDIFVQGSLAEGFGISIVEAQYSGIPIVCSDAGGLPENIKNNSTGIIFQRRNSEDLYLKIKYLIMNPNFANKLGYEAYNFARTKYNLQKEIQDLASVFEELG